ncbi:MAG TPA: bifunctional transaldolase/phosoglucose isomerase [Ktedonobacterales bacterium]|jgi:transaldolase/glucose-6-phosphate isomerase|nr:bifunctional transaldolase/phosoglucose isomerase [Ktedonobacterales bacterium]
MAQSRLHAVYELGQSIWYDNIRRSVITSGELRRLMDQDAVVGVTSNPTIFEKAIDGSTDYDAAIKSLVSRGVTEGKAVFEALAIEDVQAAADILRPIYDRTRGHDGFISLEVAPGAAHSTRETIAEARRLWQRVNRPNAMIKIPATAEGIPAIEHMIYEGVNINVTLIFALDVYARVAQAYIRGLELRQQEGQPLEGIASVASFFVSRVDTAVDALLDEQMSATSDPSRQGELRDLKGKAAIANAKLAYAAYQEIFRGERFERLRAAGATTQRCLWASTSTKNPDYRDVMYVEQLIGPETVNTMPPQTIVAFQDHGAAQPTLEDDLDGAREVMRRLEAVGVDMGAVTKQLETDGVKSFADSYDTLIASTEEKIRRLRQQAPTAVPATNATPPAAASAAVATGASLASRQKATLWAFQPEVEAALDRADRDRVAERVWKKDPTLWKTDPAQQGEIANRLGWLNIMEQMGDNLSRLDDLRADTQRAGFTHCVLLGMGGSSLAAEVIRRTFGAADGSPELLVLDSTDPMTIEAVAHQVDLAHTLFLVSSKSGETVETLSQFSYFYDLLKRTKGDDAGQSFIVITDPGTALDQLARESNLRATFRNPPDIGGRYSALSYFGLVPAAILGIDIGKLLNRAETMAQACAPSVAARENPGVWLGVILGALANQKRDKVTILASPPVATLGYWLEQLLAESTGKEGKGILPVEGEPLGAPESYGDDRVFVYLRTDDEVDETQESAIAAFEAAGHPVVRLALRDEYDLGQEFFRWEFATAVAGSLLGVNPFDQPNVQEAKDATERLLQEYSRTRVLPQPRAILQTETRNVSIVAESEQSGRMRGAISLQAAFEAFAQQARPGDYLALLAYLPETARVDDALQQIRGRMRDTLGVATTLGYGPRFQHSTAQYFKGGPNTGLFIQLVAPDTTVALIPGASYSFGTLKQAQALGDWQTLLSRGRRAIRIELGSDLNSGLVELRQAMEAIQV